MTFVITEPHIIAAVATDVEGIGSAISAAHAAAAGPTSVLLAPAADEVSAAITKLFGAYGQDYQAVVKHAAAFHHEFTQALSNAGNAYANIEGANAGALAAPQFTPINSDLTLFLGPTGNPTPTTTYVTNANNLYVRSVNALQALFTPEELYPLTGVKSMTLNSSVTEGLRILDDAITQQLPQGSTNTLTVFGYSQSAIIASLEMQKLAAMGPLAPTADQLHFVLVGNEMNPNGGMLARFPGLSIPSLGLTFYGGTPADTIYPTDIYTLEYDGFADFPQYPLNFLSDLNAVMGILTVHTTYVSPFLGHPAVTPIQVDNAIPLTTSPDYYTNGGVTHYYIIPTENLPLLDPVRAIPVIGNPIADLLQPDLKVLVNLGYGNPDYGWSTGYANVTTPFGLAPHVGASVVLGDLATGTQQGIQAFHADLANIHSTPITLPKFEPQFVQAFSPPTPSSMPPAVPPTPLNIANTIASIISTDYAVLQPTADTLLAFVTTLPAYDATLFVGQLLQGNLANAIGYPIAADIGLATVAALVEIDVIGSAIAQNIADIRSLLP
ncbi:PE family protein [Mycobacterium conspicuum]|nr:PE-PPE domain-containing protein [Mycobacterium conspicuum]ORV44317.1 PE family protein [Mycobacterium conspicuum]